MSQNPAPIAIWMALPVPAFVIDATDGIEAANPAAESFLNISERALKGQSVLSRLRVNMPMADALARVRTNAAPIFVNDVDVTVAGRAPVLCNIGGLRASFKRNRNRIDEFRSFYRLV